MKSQVIRSFSYQSVCRPACMLLFNCYEQAWELSPHFATPQLVSLRNDVWATTAEILHWRCVTTQIWVVLWLVGANFSSSQPIRSTTQIWVVTRHQYGISEVVSRTPFRRETRSSIAECRKMNKRYVFPFFLIKAKRPIKHTKPTKTALQKTQ